jgi:endonuclease YncB( thermonuclease family)
MKGQAAILAGLAIIVAIIGIRLLAAPKPPAPAIVALPPIPATALPAPAATPAPKPVAAPKPLPPPAPPPLPVQQVAIEPEHAVPEDPAPPPSRPLDLRGFDAGAEAPPPPAPRYFSGTARVTGDTSLEVGRVPVVLFGIRAPDLGTRCAGDVSCKEAAEQLLVARLAKGRVSCHSPTPNRGVVAFAVCLDGDGVDLGGTLIDDGLALADRGQSYDYVGAEGVAHNLRRGLWQFR